MYSTLLVMWHILFLSPEVITWNKVHFEFIPEKRQGRVGSKQTRWIEKPTNDKRFYQSTSRSTPSDRKAGREISFVRQKEKVFTYNFRQFILGGVANSQSAHGYWMQVNTEWCSRPHTHLIRSQIYQSMEQKMNMEIELGKRGRFSIRPVQIRTEDTNFIFLSMDGKGGDMFFHSLESILIAQRERSGKINEFSPAYIKPSFDCIYCLVHSIAVIQFIKNNKKLIIK